jgi:hypothetical protein
MSYRRFDLEFFRKLEPFFVEKGFVWVSDKSQFRKMTETGFQNVFVSIVNYESEHIIEVQFGIRNELIESMVQQFLINSNSYKSEANTLTINIGAYRGTPYFRYKIRTKEDTELCLTDIKLFFEEEGLKFMNEVADIPTLDEMLNFEPQKKNKFIYNQVHRCFKGIASAKLNDRSHFHGLIDIYRTYLLKNASDQELIHFERLVSYFLHFNAN